MNESDKARIIERYDERLKTYGATIEALASGSDDRRKMRFNVLREIGIRDGDSVLDLGCGFGDLFAYFKESGLNIQYTGIDINPTIIENAKVRFPEGDFRVIDIQEASIGRFDFVVSTSSFNLKLLNENNYAFLENLLSKCYSTATKGVAIDFLSSYVDFQGNPEQAFYYSPEKVFSIAKSITKRVCIRHDYPLFEFCVYMYPDFQGWSKV